MIKYCKTYFLIIFYFCLTTNLWGQEMVEYQPTLSDSSEVIQLLERESIGAIEQALSLSKLIDYKDGQRQALSQLVYAHASEGNTALSLRYALENIELLKIDKDYSGLYEMNYFIGFIYFEEKIFDESVDYFRKSEQLLSSGKRQKIDLWEKLGFAYYQNNQRDSALFFYHKVLNFYTKTDDYKNQVSTLKSMASIHADNQNCEGALIENQKIQELVKKKNNKILLATTYNNIGYNYHCLNDFENAILNFKKADNLCKYNCNLDKITLNTNLAVAYFNTNNFEKGANYLDKAIVKANTRNFQRKIAELNHLKATVFYQKKDLYQAQIYNKIAMQISGKRDFPEVLEKTYRLAALLNQDLYEFELALEYYQKHLELKDSLLLQERLKQQDLQQQKLLLERSEKEIKLLLINQKVQDLNYRESEKQREILKLEKDKLALETRRKEDELSLLRREQEIKEERLKIQELETARSKQELLLAQKQLAAAAKDKDIAALQQERERQKLELAKNEAQEQERLSEIENLKNKQELDSLKIQQQETFQQIAIGAGVGLLSILGLILFGFWNSQRKNHLLAQKNQEIELQKIEVEKSHDLVEKEREKSEELLLNILPLQTAKELKETGAATPKTYENVSVLFTDFINFTQLSERMSPAEIIEELNTCFLAFDEIIEKYGIEKIKTIGDAYMCVAGVPKENPDNAKNAVLAGLEMQVYIERRRTEKLAKGIPYWQMRLGIHSGGVVAGVIGSKKFAYDIWGDTVNTASRIEASGLAGKVNISATTYEIIKEDFSCEYRGTFEVKHKGEMKMYLVKNE